MQEEQKIMEFPMEFPIKVYTQEGELYVSFWTQERHWGVMTEGELDRIWNHGMTQTL